MEKFDLGPLHGSFENTQLDPNVLLETLKIYVLNVLRKFYQRSVGDTKFVFRPPLGAFKTYKFTLETFGITAFKMSWKSLKINVWRLLAKLK